MTHTLMVGYDLNRAGQGYDKLIEAIEAYGTYWHHLDSTWLIRTTKSCKEVRDELQAFIDDNDELLVAELTGVAAWDGINESGSKWLKKHL